jgi:ferredoxin-NADP reductase
MNQLPFTAKVARINRFYQEIIVVTFKLEPQSRDFIFSSGQYIDVQVGDDLIKPYSLSSAPDLLPKFEIAIKLKKDNVSSDFFNNLAIGSEIKFSQAQGAFLVNPSSKDKIFVATGVGIAPFRSYLQGEFQARQQREKVYLYYGYRFDSQDLYVEELIKLKSTYPFDFYLDLSVSQPDDAQSSPDFRVNTPIKALAPEFFKAKEIFICGSAQMSREIREILNEKQVDPGQIFDASY